MEIEAKLQTKLRVPPPVIAEYLKVLRNNAQVLDPEDVDAQVCRDPADLMVLGLVAPGNAEAIITGDKDLLVIKEYGRARIMTPSTRTTPALGSSIRSPSARDSCRRLSSATGRSACAESFRPESRPDHLPP